ncbi:SpoIIE family protein phosphatase [Azospirillum picis]|uniref:Serine phosphatase RsbU (Regulator of sigma subunit) n=1 Tax=Azospirillum picis TaxID=488438 RepID=A0ABU0MM37_9PROT|nr:SpoIIE family protein phosphatase [Azospirillum picis]MBP2300569.1 serine phosphatase RsbU (regulator of sigma subunit) [Azospirillum picis]MDQ0534538.1 serine phosphatase RsbU (regulator of sigma subunit) [Azospirillum picis]
MSVTGWEDADSYTLRGSGPRGTDDEAGRAGGSSLLTRVILMIVGCTLLVGMIAMGVSSVLVGRQQREALAHRAALIGTLQAASLGPAVWEYDTRAVEAMFGSLLAEDPAVRSVKVWAATGGRAPHSEPMAALERPAGRAELTTVERPVSIVDRNGERTVVGMLRLSYSLEEADSATLTALAPMAGLVFFSLLAVIGMISVLLNRLVLAPLARLTRSAGAIAAGDYRVRLRNRRADEIGQLTVAFNHMAETVHDYTERLEQRVAERTDELHRSSEQLAVVNRQVMDSIQYASLLQSAILPDERAMARRLDGVCVLWRPRDVVGGDFHIFRELEGGRFLVGVADCSGHGVPGAFMTMMVSAVLDHVLSEIPDSDPAAILGSLNRMVRAALARGRDNPRFDNGLDIGLCLVRPDRGDLLFAGGRIGLHIVDEAGEGAVSEVKGDAQSLGYRRSDGDHRFATHRVELAAGRSFYLTTDGFLDQAGGPRGFGFGNRRFNALLLEHRGLPMAERRAAFVQALADHQGDRPQRDDITLVGFAPAATPSSHP